MSDISYIDANNALSSLMVQKMKAYMEEITPSDFMVVSPTTTLMQHAFGSGFCAGVSGAEAYKLGGIKRAIDYLRDKDAAGAKLLEDYFFINERPIR